jgi:hypothetical protein
VKPTRAAAATVVINVFFIFILRFSCCPPGVRLRECEQTTHSGDNSAATFTFQFHASDA